MSDDRAWLEIQTADMKKQINDDKISMTKYLSEIETFKNQINNLEMEKLSDKNNFYDIQDKNKLLNQRLSDMNIITLRKWQIN